MTHDIDTAITFLNSLIALDRHAVQETCALRVPCNEAVANHPTVQVSANSRYVPPGQYRVGILGLLYGMFGDDVGHRIAANYDDDGVLTDFCGMDYSLTTG